MNEMFVKRKIKVGFGASLALAVVTILTGSCGRDDTGPVLPRSAALYTYIGDTPACDILSFRAEVSGLAFRRAGTTGNVVTLFPTPSLFVSLRMDFAALRDFYTVMYLSTLQVDSYDRADLTFRLPNVVVYDPSQDPPIRDLGATFSNSSVTIPLQPQFSVSDTKLNVLRFDFDMAKSLQFDSQGQISNIVDPVVTAVAVNKDAANTFGRFDNLAGFVSTVNPNPTGSFMGSFTLQVHNGSGQALPISIREDTSVSGFIDLRSLETGRYAEVIATVDDSGNIVADKVQVEDRVVVAENRIAFFGTVLPTPIKDPSGNVTQLKLFVRATDPDRSLDVPRNSVVTVNVSPSTAFQVSPRPDSLTPLEFGPASIAVGQELLVLGQYTLLSNQPVVVEASTAGLRPHTLQGGLSSLVDVATDGRSGAFWFSGCSTLLQSTPIMVMTTNQDTAFVNVFGLSDISPQATLFVRGFPFFVRDATVIRGVPIPAGTLVMFAAQIRQAN